MYSRKVPTWYTTSSKIQILVRWPTETKKALQFAQRIAQLEYDRLLQYSGKKTFSPIPTAPRDGFESGLELANSKPVLQTRIQTRESRFSAILREN